MKGTVNPFEPWRPVESRIPAPLHAGRPWRPPPPPPVRRAVEVPPLVEPDKRPTRNKAPALAKRSRGRAQAPFPTPRALPQWIAFLVLCVLGIICLDSVGWYRVTHIPRLAILGISAGVFAGMAFSRRRSWRGRLSWMASALVLAAIALWFVPTTHGVTLWSAYERIEHLRSLPASDVAEYHRGEGKRRALAKDFPFFAADVRAAEQAWLRRTVDNAIERADRQLDRDPDAALALLQQLDKELSGQEHYASVRKDLESARRRAVQACLKVAQQP